MPSRASERTLVDWEIPSKCTDSRSAQVTENCMLSTVFLLASKNTFLSLESQVTDFRALLSSITFTSSKPSQRGLSGRTDISDWPVPCHKNLLHEGEADRTGEKVLQGSTEKPRQLPCVSSREIMSSDLAQHKMPRITFSGRH